VGASCLQLKLLSLQGDKTACTIHQLQFLKQDQQQQPTHHTPTAAEAQSTSSTSGQQQQQQPSGADAAPPATAAAAASSGQQPSLSQLEELRMLIQQLHTPGMSSATLLLAPLPLCKSKLCRLAVSTHCSRVVVPRSHWQQEADMHPANID
jgi:hypothetical protein